MRILITGATGNIGKATIDALLSLKIDAEVVAGLRDIKNDVMAFEKPEFLEFQEFDFEKVDQFNKYLEGIDTLFLLRPPQISDTKKYFQPLIAEAIKLGLEHIVFLSVQGADKNSIIPHYKIEKMIMDSGIPYTFLRPAYFMQNFTTTLRKDIIEKSEVFLPAGNAKFTVVDAKDIGLVAAKILLSSEDHQNEAYDLTNNEKLTFGEMVHQINEITGQSITFKSPNLVSFFIRKSKEGVPTMLILVMIMLHYFPRFQATPDTSDSVLRITGNEPGSFKRFVVREQELLSQITK
ncbi:NmrA family NAD(P)-binding protein [Marivirga harenae]|uniref:NmrA family NAD(P)-binding protein n=1 Tax=Marivirga harenae TaxID=2010992 RepID=UPI0026E019C7|nr:NmrA family NAD(P)-binding protein [Marivirga harenae]WKV12502.1 NmrA family NAD(P)-binding protein [Marivirga harenae]|tara:strand:+ start:15654 stop:16532 length:879 start_codon:yes stop_codon:yes gene_type:complete